MLVEQLVDLVAILVDRPVFVAEPREKRVPKRRVLGEGVAYERAEIVG